ncbi:MAG TPA: VWA domain-containing protein, partial [Herpetosiphonaceae bacterium]|nr:VWA domain-containing protein [Herpetosiphonaceae bacterium]
MSTGYHPSPDELYSQGLQHFNRGEWEAAISSFTELQELSDRYPGVNDLLADAQLKLRLADTEMPAAKPPPRRPIWVPLLAILALCLVAGGGYTVYSQINTPVPTPADVAIVTTAVGSTTIPQPQTATISSTAPPLATAASVLSATVVVTPAENTVFVSSPDNIEIIMDASGSMLTRVGDTDRQRWQVAQEALKTLINSGAIAEQSNVALRTYGRRRSADCSDVEMMQPLRRFNRDALLAAADAIKPVALARTPLAASIREAANDLLPAEGSTVLIVVSDGDETCEGDPVAEAANFVKDAPWRQVHVIGFALDNPVDADRLLGIAANGNGQYLEANNSAELAAALRQTIQLNYRILAEDGREAAQGTVGAAPVQIDPGTYTL